MTSVDMLEQLEAVRFTTDQARLLIKFNENQRNLLATKKDVDFLSGQIENVQGQFKNMDVKIDDLEERLEAKIENVRGEIENVRGEIENVRGEIENVRGEVRNVKGEIENIKDDVKEIKQKLSGLVKEEELEKMRDSLKLLITSSINKTKYDIAKWIVGAVVANGLIATLLSVFT